MPARLPRRRSLLAPVQPGDRPLCVLNTHLFYHYMAPHIRTMHVWVMAQEAQLFMDEAMADPQLAAQLGGQRPALLFCGDMNSGAAGRLRMKGPPGPDAAVGVLWMFRCTAPSAHTASTTPPWAHPPTRRPE